MQQQQEESLIEIQLKLNEMAKIKGDLISTNYFKPNILNMHMEQMKQKYFWLGHINFNWSKMKSIKKKKN
jgi:hypothetical protein